jgi:RYK receptor-like tyrosine kinase
MEAAAEAGVVHRDLAARNCLLLAARPPVVRITDFGLSLLFPCHAPASTITVGTRSGRPPAAVPARWAPPEGLGTGAWGEASDVWSFGVLLWEVTSVCPHSFLQGSRIHCPALAQPRGGGGGAPSTA